ncbi:hypothetical protein Clacol_006110 [Clathrus columnatus]|uniref:Zn(2)-C6 fungal-type domain-containing protein n=1 Tax=Clathrus columnatus TaxID=1419009 RepID=A0AAV5ADT5_9AGAM|nr:hypothetical protein Clacol_006110 [Clathrus columnatus]
MPPSSAASNSSGSASPTSQRQRLPSGGPASKRKREKDTQFKAMYPLQRGSACLSCRKRKMKCDAGKPACAQCVKANRAVDCDYDDGKSKSRTQILQEKISTLETRLRELEGPAVQHRPLPIRHYSSPADQFYPGALGDPLIGTSSSPSSFDLTSISGNGSPTPGSPDSWSLSWEVDSLSLNPDDFFKMSGRWWEAEMPPPRISQYLLEIFLQHRHQCGFEIDVNRFQASLNSTDPPHPALMNAIYALSCHFSLSPMLSPHESGFVSRSLRAISVALEASDRLVQVLHASCLLAILFFAKGRLLEGYYHAGAAARLAVGLGLHQISAPDWNTSGGSPGSSAASSSSGAGGSSILPPPMDALELGERILTFWQVYNIDRCWAVATGLPVALPEDTHPRTRIETPWPRSIEEYELGRVDNEGGSVLYLCSQLVSSPYSGRESANSLRAKATTLFERAARISSSFGAGPQTDQFWVDFQNLDTAISRLSMSIPPARTSIEDHSGRTVVDTSLFVIHALLQAATIQLHSQFAFKDVASQQKSATVAALATAMVHDLEESDYPFLDPIMGTCWTSIAEALLRELIVLRQTPQMEQQVASLNRQLDIIVLAMNRLGTTVPLAEKIRDP